MTGQHDGPADSDSPPGTTDAAPSTSLELPPPDATAVGLFAARLPLAEAYARLLAGTGVEHGLIGPREVPRLWPRHLVNSALLADLLPHGARVVDVGSGAGLPGVPMAIRRDDLSVDLLEPMLRRVSFLEDVVGELGLGASVRVTRGRAEDASVRTSLGPADWVVARAVAPLDRLVRWCLPLLTPGGRLLALKGSGAEAEVAEHRGLIGRLGGGSVEIVPLPAGAGAETTWVVSMERTKRTPAQRKGRPR